MEKLQTHLLNIVTKNLEVPVDQLNSKERFIIIFDLKSPLSRVLAEGYQKLLPHAININFDEQNPEELKVKIKEFTPGKLFILIESSSFRLSNFRWRLELFNRGHGVIEHAHLGSNLESETENYIDTLEYRHSEYEKAGNYLKPLIEACKKITVECVGTTLIYEGGMEEAKKNLADFRNMKNKGSGFPVGEVFSEPKNFDQVNGEVMIYAFANTQHRVIFPEKPFKLIIEKGCVHAENPPQEFQEVIDMIKTENPDGLIRIREFGLGLNPGVSKTKRLTDISAFERVKGLHVSLGMKHDIYRKKFGEKQVQRFHVDIFPDVQKITIDDTVIFENGEYFIQ